MRPLVKPALRRLWRDGDTLQLGVGPDRALLLPGMRVELRSALELIDGSRTPAEVARDAAALGVDESEALGLIAELERGGGLDDAGAGLPSTALQPELSSLSLQFPAPGLAEALLARRGAAHVQVVGAGRVGGTVAQLLAAAGVGAVSLTGAGEVRVCDVMPGGVPFEAVGATPGEALDLPVPVPGQQPDLVVLAPPGSAEAALGLAQDLRQRGTPHLVARVRELTGVVGPLVLPGRTSCLVCVHLHRVDRDPGWPVLALQLAARPSRGDAAAVALCAFVAATAAMQVLQVLDAPPGDPGPASAGGSLELTLPDWRLRRRSWPAHPECGCLTAIPSVSGSARDEMTGWGGG